MCVCVCERERERVCLCVCVSVPCFPAVWRGKDHQPHCPRRRGEHKVPCIQLLLQRETEKGKKCTESCSSDVSKLPPDRENQPLYTPLNIFPPKLYTTLACIPTSEIRTPRSFLPPILRFSVTIITHMLVIHICILNTPQITGGVCDGSGRAHYVLKGYWDEGIHLARVLEGEGKNATFSDPEMVWSNAPPQ